MALSDELTRLRTFPDLYDDIESLARAGFYYTGVDDILKCFSCKTVYTKLHEKPHEEVHRRMSPGCWMLINSDPANIPNVSGEVPSRESCLNREVERLRSKTICKTCKKQRCNILFFPCHHLVMCSRCLQGEVHNTIGASVPR